MAVQAEENTRKYHSIAQDIRAKILGGVYPERIPGERQLAQIYDVHILTANKAVSVLVKEGLLYRSRGRGTFVKRLRRRSTGNLAVIVGDVLAPLHARIVLGIQEIASRADQHLLFCNYRNTPLREQQFVDQLLEQEKADGFLVWPTSFDLRSEAMRRLEESGLPYVVFPHVEPDVSADINYVISDDQNGARLGVRYLIELGHKRIAFVYPEHWNADTLPFRNRRKGYLAALESAGLSPGPELQLAAHALDALEAAVRAGEVTALFCLTDNTAIATLQGLRHRGLRAPESVSVLGFDGTPRGGDFDLTTVEQPMEAIGETAALALLDLMENHGQEPVHRALQCKLIVRSSVAHAVRP